MTTQEVMQELARMGNESTKKVLMKHGAKEPFFGVKVEDLKKILKKTKKNHDLALQLYNTGNSDAMYLAGLMADEQKITKEDLQSWVKKAYWYYLSEFAVAWVAAESKYGVELANEWIDAKEESIISAGWATWSNILSITPDNELDIQYISSLLDRVQKTIHTSPNRSKQTMNAFVIAVGCFVKPLTDKALKIGNEIGKVEVDMGGTACKVPYSPEYIQKSIDKGSVGKKKKMARC
jgi:3-methyladenine DNA glycosylase AlkD